MSIFDALTGNPGKQAAEDQKAIYLKTLGLGGDEIKRGLATSKEYLNQGYGQGRQALDDYYGKSTGYINQGADDALGYLNQGQQGASNQFAAGRAAYQPLQDLGKKYGGATTLALNALGVNGADAAKAARGSFQTGVGYNFNLDQGLEAINRRRAAGGMLNSGNADQDSQIFGAGLASQEYDKWLGGLQSYINPELQATQGAASGIAGLSRDEALMLERSGVGRAGIASGRGTMLADLASKQGANLNNSFQGQYGGLAGLETDASNRRVSLLRGLTEPYAQTYADSADASMKASGNAINLGMNVAKMAAGMPGGFGGGAGFGSNASPMGWSNAPSYPNPHGGSWYG